MAQLAEQERQEFQVRACLKELARSGDSNADETEPREPPQPGASSIIEEHFRQCASRLPHLAPALSAFDAKTPHASAKLVLSRLPAANPRPLGAPLFERCRRLGECLVECSCDIVPFDVLELGPDATRGLALAQKYYRRCHFGYLSRGFEVAKTPDGGWSTPESSREVAVKTVKKADFLRYEAACFQAGSLPAEDPYRGAAAVAYLSARTDAVVPLLGLYEDAEWLYLPSPFCRGGDLRDRICRHKQRHATTTSSQQEGEDTACCDEASTRRAFRRLAERVASLHAVGVAHNDLSLDNVVCADDADRDDLKLIDLAMSVICVSRRPLEPPTSNHLLVAGNTPTSCWPCRCGKALYTPPDALRGARTCDVFKADVFALGVCLFVLLVGAPPCNECDRGCVADDPVYAAIAQGKLAALLAGWGVRPLSESCLDLISGLLRADASTRPDINDVLRHPWLLSNNYSGSLVVVAPNASRGLDDLRGEKPPNRENNEHRPGDVAEEEEDNASDGGRLRDDALLTPEDQDDDDCNAGTHTQRGDERRDAGLALRGLLDDDDLDDERRPHSSGNNEVWELVLPPHDLDLDGICAEPPSDAEDGARLRSPPFSLSRDDRREDDDGVAAFEQQDHHPRRRRGRVRHRSPVSPPVVDAPARRRPVVPSVPSVLTDR